VRKNNRTARAARFFCENVWTQSAKQRHENVLFEVLTTRARSSKSLILCLCMKTIGAKQAKMHLACFAERHQLGIIAKQLT